jgi:hypothetical protein
MSWLIDNVHVVYLLLGLVALGFVTAWWLNKRVKFLVYAGAVLAMIGVIWLLKTQVLAPTDREQIERNVEEMADGVVRGDVPAVLKHISKDFRYKDMTREQLAAVIEKTRRQLKIVEVKVREVDFEDGVSRAKGSTRVRFKASAFDKDSVLGVVFCIADFTLEDGQWKLKTIEFKDGLNPDRPMPGAP